MELKDLKRLARNKRKREKRLGHKARIREDEKIKRLQEEYLAKRGA